MRRKHQPETEDMTSEEATFFATHQFFPPTIVDGELSVHLQRRIEAMRKIAMDSYDPEENRRLSAEIGYLAQHALQLTAQEGLYGNEENTTR